jgi:RNA polymerase sigma-70 factor (ECF subfamily)
VSAQKHDDPGVRLMLAWQGGDEAAFGRLVVEYSGRVHSLLTRFLGPVAGREDLVQEVFLRVIRARDRYEPTAALSTWLYRIAFNLCANERARAGRGALSLDAGAEDGLDPADERAPDPASGLERDDVVHAVRAAIDALPDMQRMALVLARYEEMSFAEIAGVLDSSEKAVKSLVHRARESLRARLKPFLAGELPA